MGEEVIKIITNLMKVIANFIHKCILKLHLSYSEHFARLSTIKMCSNKFLILHNVEYSQVNVISTFTLPFREKRLGRLLPLL